MPAGRPRKPSAIKKLEGNRRKLGKDRITEDLQTSGRPACPAYLSASEKARWREVVSSLPRELLTSADNSILERFAIAHNEFRECHIKVRTIGEMVKGPNGPVKNPLIYVRNQAREEMHRSGEALGLSPASRARLTNPERIDDDPLTLLLGDDLDPDGAWSTVSKTRQ